MDTIFLTARDIVDPVQRAAYVADACGADGALRARIEEMLKHHEAAEDYFGFHDNAPAQCRAMPVSEGPGALIGRYKLLEKIGEGGMGIVYMAEQREPVKRRVALKVIKVGMDTRQVVARFEAERQALALMDHPNIAKVLDGGETEQGRPYFVMELVQGLPVTEFCDEAKLGMRERLELFLEICSAIQHAHQKGIIHRDIKPTNILVTLHVDKPVPKVIDFGIAKATQQPLTDKTLFTQFQHFIGTPAYMSPEQATLTTLDIDTRSDIYALGVLLYELLTGHTPFDGKELIKSGLDEMRRTIREKEPPRPSTRLKTLLGADLTTAAKRRGLDAPKLIHLLCGDLDWIVMKAIEKDRARRYETANGLLMDIQRHLKNEPIIARPPSAAYRFQKAYQRNKPAFAAAAAVVIVLFGGIIASTWQAARAKREAVKALAVSNFLTAMLNLANPDSAKGPDYTVRQLLDDASAGLGKQFENQPEVEASMHHTIGGAFHALGDGAKAQPHLERALALRQRTLGDRHYLVGYTRVTYAWSLFEQGNYAEAEVQARRALDIYRKNGTAGEPVFDAVGVLQRALCGLMKFQEAEVVTREAIALAERTPPHEFSTLASLLHGLAEVKNKQARHAEAEVYALRAVEMHRRLRGNDHSQLAWALLSLGDAQMRQDKLMEAEVTLRETLRIFRKVHSETHKSVLLTMGLLRQALKAKGDVASLESLAKEELAQATSRLQQNGTDPAAWLHRALACADLKQWDEAARDAKQAAKLSNSSPDRTGIVELGCLRLAALLIYYGKKPEADALLQELAASEKADVQNELGWYWATWADPKERDGRRALEVAEKAVAITNRRNPSYLDTLAAAHAQSGQFIEAIHVQREAIGLIQNEGERKQYASKLNFYLLGVPYRHHLFLAETADSLLGAGKFAEAEPLARDCVSILEIEDPRDWRTFNARSLLGGSLVGQGKYVEAEPLLLSSYEGLKDQPSNIPEKRRILNHTIERIVALYGATARTDQAAVWKQRLTELDRPNK